MKVLFLCLLLTGCYSTTECVDGKLWININPMAADNIYEPTGRDCKAI